MKGLTERQTEILSFIESYINDHSVSPSFREIQKHFNFQSLGSVAKHISALKKKGVIYVDKHASRSIIPVVERPSSGGLDEVELPFIGHLSYGSSIETFPQTQKLAVPSFLVQNPDCTYVFRARGEMLEDEMISDGDLLLVEATPDAIDGDTIVGALPDNPTVVKKYHPEGNYVRLASRSNHIDPIILRHDELSIQGIFRGLLRVYQ